MNGRYERMIEELERTGMTQATCRGNSMLPILTNPSECYFERQRSYAIGDIVFCKVRGRFIDAHKIVAMSTDGRYQIANNHGHVNGWTRTIYGKVVRAVLANGDWKEFV